MIGAMENNQSNNLAGDSSLETENPQPERVVTNPVQQKPPKPKKDKQKVIAWILVVLLAMTAGAFAWLYFTKDNQANEPVQEQAADDDSQTADADTGDDSADASKTVYEAEVGKFKLELDPTYVVIEKLDGPFEGGPASIIDIGETTTSTGVVSLNPAQPFSLFARPEAGATIATNSRVMALEGDDLAKPQANGEFAGETTRVYQVDGLFSTRHIIWVKNGIVYELAHISEDETHAAMLRVVEAGFSFVQ